MKGWNGVFITMLILKTRCLKMTGQRRMHSFQSSILFSCMYNHTLIINYQALKCNCCWNSVMLASYSDFCKQTIFVEYTWKNLLNIYDLRDLHVLRYWWDPLQKSTQAYIVKLLPRDPQTFPRKLWGGPGSGPRYLHAGESVPDSAFVGAQWGASL